MTNIRLLFDGILCNPKAHPRKLFKIYFNDYLDLFNCECLVKRDNIINLNAKQMLKANEWIWCSKLKAYMLDLNLQIISVCCLGNLSTIDGFNEYIQFLGEGEDLMSPEHIQQLTNIYNNIDKSKYSGFAKIFNNDVLLVGLFQYNYENLKNILDFTFKNNKYQ